MPNSQCFTGFVLSLCCMLSSSALADCVVLLHGLARTASAMSAGNARGARGAPAAVRRSAAASSMCHLSRDPPSHDALTPMPAARKGWGAAKHGVH